jgi:hypothetical protein
VNLCKIFILLVFQVYGRRLRLRLLGREMGGKDATVNGRYDGREKRKKGRGRGGTGREKNGREEKDGSHTFLVWVVLYSIMGE